ALESYKWGHSYIDGLWYANNTADWQTWNVSHAEPLLSRMYSGKSDRLANLLPALYAGKEVVVPGMVDGNVEELRQRRARLQRRRSGRGVGRLQRGWEARPAPGHACRSEALHQPGRWQFPR